MRQRLCYSATTWRAFPKISERVSWEAKLKMEIALPDLRVPGEESESQRSFGWLSQGRWLLVTGLRQELRPAECQSSPPSPARECVPCPRNAFLTKSRVNPRTILLCWVGPGEPCRIGVSGVVDTSFQGSLWPSHGEGRTCPVELAAWSLCYLGSSGEESRHLSLVPSARITCLEGEGIKVTQCLAEFS